jgi:hypothetical protein
MNLNLSPHTMFIEINLCPAFQNTTIGQFTPNALISHSILNN